MAGSEAQGGTRVCCLVMFSLLLICLDAVYLAVESGNRKAAEAAMAAMVAVTLLAFLVWFVLYGPTPDYLPPYGTDPQDLPHQMRN